MFNFDEKDLFNKCVPKPPHKHFTMNEEIEHTSVLMKETIDRLLKFEERLKHKVDDAIKNITSDNVLFKNVVNDAYKTFLSEVKNEINLFEGTTNADLLAFKNELETSYENLATDVQEQYNTFVEAVNSRIDANNNTHSQAFTDFQTKLTTNLNMFEGTMNTNYNTFTESVNNTISSFKNTWEQIITERLNTQDSVISDNELYMKTNLHASISTLLGDMKDNGEFDEIIESEVFNELEEKIEGSNVLYYGAVGDGETDCTNAIKLAIAQPIVIFPKGTYVINEAIEIPETCKMIIGLGATFTTSTNGLDYKLKAIDIEGLIISGVKFDSALKSRGSIKFDNCKNVVVKNCSFTGYTAEYGYYETDSQINVLGGSNISIADCEFYDNGNQYTLDDNKLNRCITADGDFVKITGCKFENVMQGIVGNGTNVVIDNNKMTGLIDNCVYLFGSSKVTNNYFNSTDEGVVVSGETHIISNNEFEGVLNKSVAVCGHTNKIVIANNIFEECANLYATRNNTYKVNSLTISHNTMKSIEKTENRGNLIYLPNADFITITDNVLNALYNGTAYYAIIGVDSVNINSLIITDNIFNDEGEAVNSGVYSEYGTPSIKDFVSNNNIVTGNVVDSVNDKTVFYKLDLKKYGVEANANIDYAYIVAMPDKYILSLKFKANKDILGDTVLTGFDRALKQIGLSMNSAVDLLYNEGNSKMFMLNGSIYGNTLSPINSGVTVKIVHEFER